VLCAAGLYYIKVHESNRFVINNDNGKSGRMQGRSLWRHASHYLPSFILPIRIRASGTRMTRRGAPLNTKRCGRPDTSETRVEFSTT